MLNTIPRVDPDDGLVVRRMDMPAELDEGAGWRARIGLIVLATDQSLEYEFRRVLRDIEGVAVYESRIYNATTITPDSLRDMEAGIGQATGLLVPGVPLRVVAYACTSGSMMIGDDVVRTRIHAVRPGVATSTPMQATFAALRALGVERIALMAPYMERICEGMRAYTLRHGFAVPVMGSWCLQDDNQVARISPASIRRAVLDLGGLPEAQAVFVACTSLHLAEQIDALEDALGKPVISSNQALIWHCLRLAGVDDRIAGFGSLFTKAGTQGA